MPTYEGIFFKEEAIDEPDLTKSYPDPGCSPYCGWVESRQCARFSDHWSIYPTNTRQLRSYHMDDHYTDQTKQGVLGCESRSW